MALHQIEWVTCECWLAAAPSPEEWAREDDYWDVAVGDWDDGCVATDAPACDRKMPARTPALPVAVVAGSRSERDDPRVGDAPACDRKMPARTPALPVAVVAGSRSEQDPRVGDAPEELNSRNSFEHPGLEAST